jgi:hypothetical protein
MGEKEYNYAERSDYLSHKIFKVYADPMVKDDFDIPENMPEYSSFSELIEMDYNVVNSLIFQTFNDEKTYFRISLTEYLI